MPDLQLPLSALQRLLLSLDGGEAPRRLRYQRRRLVAPHQRRHRRLLRSRPREPLRFLPLHRRSSNWSRDGILIGELRLHLFSPRPTGSSRRFKKLMKCCQTLQRGLFIIQASTIPLMNLMTYVVSLNHEVRTLSVVYWGSFTRLLEKKNERRLNNGEEKKGVGKKKHIK